MKSYCKFVLISFASTIIICGCQKEGPAGAVGPAGVQGPAGPTGPTGPAGSANVVYSAWFTPAQNGNWVDTSINGVAAQKKFNKSAPGITLNVLNTGVILSYLKLNPDGAGGTTASIRQMPYANPGAANVFFAMHYVGSITIAVISTANPGVAVTASSTALEFRYIIIPGVVQGGRLISGPAKGYTKNELMNLSYEKIESMFNIPQNGSNE